METEAELGGARAQARERVPEPPGVVGEDEDVVAVADELAEAEVRGEEMIQRREVEVRPDL